MTPVIGLDWGTTSLRAYRLLPSGEVAEARSAPQGILQVPAGGFEAVLLNLVGDWITPNVPVLASGMVGSRQGWVETPYLPLPCSPEALADHLVPVPLQQGGTVHVVPGVQYANPQGRMDVMRGEETQALGTTLNTGLLILPGSHSKWVQVQDGLLKKHITFLTGELFAALHQHTLLGRLMTATDPHEAAFAQGVRDGLAPAAGSGGLLHQLFEVRTLGLFEQLPGEGLYDYLSGLLMGTEIREACAAFPEATERRVVGASALSKRYLQALALAGLSAVAEPPDAAARGLFRLAQLRKP